MFRVDKNDFKKIESLINKGVTRGFADAGKLFIRLTPKDKGQARRRTKVYNTNTRKIIDANYDYAGVLDKGQFPNPPKKGTGKTTNGFSTQAPKGMSEPTNDALPKLLENRFKNLGLL